MRKTGAGPAIVFVHGAGGSGQVFSRQFQAFRDSASCYFVDLPGHGKSQREGEIQFSGYVRSIASLIETLSPPVTVIGHSMGGAIAIDVVLQRPELVRSLILVATGCRLPVPQEMLADLESDYERTLGEILSRSFSQKASAEMLERARTNFRMTAPDVVRSDFHACAQFNRCDLLSTVQAPALVVSGTHDRMTPPTLSDELHRRMPGSRLERIHDGSHMLMLENADAFNSLIADFLGGQLALSSGWQSR